MTQSPAEAALSTAPQTRATVTLHYRGVPVMFELPNPRAAQIVALVDRYLEAEGWSAPPSGGTNTQQQRLTKPAALRQEPFYRADGVPCCPVHQTPLREGQRGQYCPSRAEGIQANEKGYCRYTWKEDVR